MRFIQIFKLNYLMVILIAILFTWYFLYLDQNKLVSASEKSIPSVVTITTKNDKYNINNSGGIGSGVIFSKDGYIVTNFHILSGSNIEVSLNNGESYPATVIGIDKNADIAVLKIDINKNLTPINFANSDELKIGDKVLAIGNPYDVGISVSSGIVSATGRDYGNPYLELIQTDAAINPGNSGGALINENGNLIGINSKIFSKTGGYQGIGFAIPSNLVVQIATQLIRHGDIQILWIGNFRVSKVKVQSNGALIDGLKIIQMEKLGPLYENNINVGDIIIKVNEDNANWKNLRNSLRFATLGETIELKILKSENKIVKMKFLVDDQNTS